MDYPSFFRTVADGSFFALVSYVVYKIGYKAGFNDCLELIKTVNNALKKKNQP